MDYYLSHRRFLDTLYVILEYDNTSNTARAYFGNMHFLDKYISLLQIDVHK